MIKFLLGLAFTILGVFSLIVLTFAYRDFSFELFVIFLFSLIGYPCGVYMMIKHRKFDT